MAQHHQVSGDNTSRKFKQEMFLLSSVGLRAGPKLCQILILCKHENFAKKYVYSKNVSGFLSPPPTLGSNVTLHLVGVFVKV